MSQDLVHISRNLKKVRARIDITARQSGRRAEDIRLVVVGKNRSVAEVSAAVAAGAQDLGENRVKELVAKKAELRLTAKWHFIGTLQRNKVKNVVGAVDLIQSVDRFELGVEIDKRAKNAEIVQPILVQVNVAKEFTKHGVDLKNLKKLVAELDKLGHIRIEGLMTIAPQSRDAELARPVFAELRQAYEALLRYRDLKWLSMGMTDDFAVAVEEGSNMIRVGRAIFTDEV